MTLISTKQINQIVGAPVKASSFSANGASNSVTTIIATTLATASNSGGAVSVTNAVSYNTQGVVVGTVLKIRIQNNATKKALVTSSGYEIFGELTYSNPTYTLTYYYLNAAGVKTTTSISGPITIDFIFYYQFKVKDLPVSALNDTAEFYYNGHPITVADITGTAGGCFVTTNASTLKAETVYAFNGYAIPFSSINYVATNVGAALDEAILSGFPAVLSQDVKLADGYVYTAQNGFANFNPRFGAVNSQAFVGSNLLGTTGWSFYTPSLAKIGFGLIGGTPQELILDVTGATLNSLNTILGFNQEVYLANNAGSSVTTSNTNKNAIAIGSRNVTLNTAVVNTVVLGGNLAGFVATVSNTIYTPDKMYMVNSAGFVTQLQSQVTAADITLNYPIITSKLLGVVAPLANYFAAFDNSGNAIIGSSLLQQDATTMEVGLNATPVVGTIFSVDAFNAAGSVYGAAFQAIGNLATSNYALTLNAQNGLVDNIALLVSNGDIYQQGGRTYIGLTPDATVKLGVEFTTELIGNKVVSTFGGLALQTGAYVDISGVNTLNRALYLSATNGVDNYALTVAAGQTLIGSSVATSTSSLIEFNSATRAALYYPITTVQMNAIASPAKGMIVMNDTTSEFYFYNGTIWQTLQTTGTITGSGTANVLTKFSGATTITDSSITDDGFDVLVKTTKVGIGTITSAISNLEVASNNSKAIIVSSRYQTSALAAAGFVGRFARGTQSVPTAVLSGDAISDFGAIGYSGAAFNTPSAAAQFSAAENFTAIASGTDFNLWLAPIGSLVPVKRLTVLNSGFVGIGNTTPSYNLEVGSGILSVDLSTSQVLVNGTSFSQAAFEASINPFSSYPIAGYFNTTHTFLTYAIYAEAVGAGVTNTGGYFNASGATDNFALVTDNGFVGIGNTNPLYNFEVGTSVFIVDTVNNVVGLGSVNVGTKLQVDATGTNTIAANFTQSAVTAVNFGIRSFANGAGTTNYAAYFSARNATNNHALVVPLNEGNVGIGTITPNASAILELNSTTGALLVPRMTTAQRTALTATDGMIVYDTTVIAFYFYENGAWVTGSGLV